MATPINHLAQAKRKLPLSVISLTSLWSKAFILLGGTMDKILESALAFKELTEKEYYFVVSHNRKTREIFLSFKIEDFRHAVGLQYLDDIQIESNPTEVVNAILNRDITDSILEKSVKYRNTFVEANNEKSGTVEERIEEMRYLEHFLDNSDFLRIYKMQSFGSHIRADYFIEATNKARHVSIYVFIRKRDEDDTYVIVSFFKKRTVFTGDNTYWMLKAKYEKGAWLELMRHKDFAGECPETSEMNT